MTTTLDLDTIHLAKGGHRSPDEGACLLEATSMFANEPFGDAPTCVSRVLRSAGIALNDCITDDTERDNLRDLIPHLVGTAGDENGLPSRHDSAHSLNRRIGSRRSRSRCICCEKFSESI